MRRLTLTLVSGCLALGAAAIASAQGMTLKQLAELESVGNAAISPGGDMIAYTRTVPRTLVDEEDGRAWSELYLIDRNGEHRPFITGHVNVGSIGWMPDESAITFLAKRDDDEHTRLYAIPINGGEAQPIATLGASISSYSLNNDGTFVALLAFEPEDAQRQKEKEYGFDQYVFEEEWTPRRVFILDLKDDKAEPRVLELDGSAQSARWSPAGDRLAVAVTPRQLVDDTLMFQKLLIVSTDGDVIGRIDNPGKLGEFEWSPDGEHLAFLSAEKINDTTAGRLMVSGKNGGSMHHLMPGLLGHVRAIDWYDTNNVLFISHEGVHSRLAKIGFDGENETTLLHAGGPIWSNLSATSDGRAALLASTPEHPTEVYRFGNGGSIPERVTNSNP
ncbi:MAG: TolB family protein, partial [Planctomycetota bacterium]